jgi:hypothetical protein
MAATLTRPQTIKFEPLWAVLKDIGWMSIPVDLSEIDAAWCYFALADQGWEETDYLLGLCPHDIMDTFAHDLRALWSDAMCPAFEW